MYKLLIKASGSSKSEVFKFYREPGVVVDYEVDTIEELTGKYNELLEKYPKSDIFPIHNLKVELNTEIEEAGDPVPGDITGVDVTYEDGIVLLTALGKNLPTAAAYNWTVICNEEYRFNLISVDPTVRLNEVQSASFQSAEQVIVSVSIGKDEKLFVVKEI